MSKTSITLPKILAQQIQAHSFSALLYPQQFGSIGSAAESLALGQFGLDDLVAGITKITKNFEKTVKERRSLGRYSYEAMQNIPTALHYKFSLSKVIYYKTNSIQGKAIEIDDTGLIKQFFPLTLQELIKNPDGTIKSVSQYIDCWITSDHIDLDLQSEDTLEIRNLEMQGIAMQGISENYVGYVEAIFGSATSEALSAINNVNTILSDFKI
jgi:hypothetical protein